MTIAITGLATTWYFDIWHKPVETIDELIGMNFDYAHKLYFKTDPENHYKINVNYPLNEFDGGIYKKRSILKDSIVHVYTWRFINHKQTIWVGETEIMKSEIIDANRYKNSIRF
ncbi:hypothetical protein [Arcicella rigui]|uniref:Uncharacterized protein n=1 Tax=Arcicella rigui TaxID=797020 RepID=A0ABU5Q764_9BACT|nr:hypothetical protein [Arcicella rigui]MEA5138659.1 hypothetical protein [Arcicella rigui]